MSGTVKNSMRISPAKVDEIVAMRATIDDMTWRRILKKAIGRVCEPEEMTLRDYTALKRQIGKGR